MAREGKVEARLSIEAELYQFARVQAAIEGYRGPAGLVEKLLREYWERVGYESK